MIFGILIGFALFVTAVVLPWINWSHIRELRDDLGSLKSRLDQIDYSVLKLMEKLNLCSKDTSEAVPPLTPEQKEAEENEKSQTQRIQENLLAQGRRENEQLKENIREIEDIQARTKQAYAAYESKMGNPPLPLSKSKTKTEQQNIEQKMGGRLFVWMGGIALALAGVFMVKYSIEAGILSPAVRTVIGILFGIGLLIAGNWTYDKSNMAGGDRIGMSLSGAGVVTLYASILAATSLYDLIPPMIGFAGMIVVTAAAVIQSLRHGMPIALLGLVGGFVTPALIGSNSPSAISLFAYLYLLFAGLMYIIRRQNWHGLGTLSTFFALLWCVIWVFGSHFSPSDGVVISIFLFAVCGTIIRNPARDALDNPDTMEFEVDSPIASKFLATTGSLLLMGIVSAKSGYTLIDWGMYGLLSIGSVVLASFNQKLYGKLPWLAMIITGFLLIQGPVTVPLHFGVIIIAFLTLFVGAGLYFELKSENPPVWAGLSAMTALGYYLIAYAKLHNNPMLPDWLHYWGFMAFGATFLCTLILQERLKRIHANASFRQTVLAIHAGAASSFLSIGLAIELDQPFLSLAFAGEIFALSWLTTKFDIKALRTFVVILAGIFFVLIFPTVARILPEFISALTHDYLSHNGLLGIKGQAIVQLGLPALLFGGSSLYLRRGGDDNLVASFEMIAMGLLGILAYILGHQVFHVPDMMATSNDVSFIERATVTNLFFALGFGSLRAGRYLGRKSVSMSGMIFCGLAAIRLIGFDFMIYNPLWSDQSVGSWPILNGLLLCYGLPIFWTAQGQREIERLGRNTFSNRLGLLSLVLAFTLVTLNIRQFFHGTRLDIGTTTDAEIYTYSIVWLVFGIGLLLYGAAKRVKDIRIAALAVVTLTIGKVFLYDASALEGLWRVFSFAGLGLSLLGLSWFYARFIVNMRVED